MTMIVSTTPSLEGYRIVRYLGLVSGEAIVGANIFRDVFAKVRDVIGGRAGGYERALAGAREQSVEEMCETAKKLGGNAVVGVDLDYETLTNMLMACASGTAVVVEKIE